MGQPNNNPFNTISCLDTSSAKSLIMGNGNLSIIQGAKTLFTLSFTDFLPLNIYQYKEFVLAANTSPSTGASSIQLEACNTTNDSGEDSTVIVIVEYPALDLSSVAVPTDDKFINFTYPLGSTAMNIGKIMILSGTNGAGAGWDLVSSPGGMLLSNPHTNFAVNVKVLILA